MQFRKERALSGCAGCEWDVVQFLKVLADETG